MSTDAFVREDVSVLVPAGDAAAEGHLPGDSFSWGDGTTFANPELARQLAMANGEARAYAARIAATRPVPVLPRPYPERLGTPEWYDARRDDHLIRHEGNPEPPSYYLAYGKKYCLRFSEALYPDLSDAGQRWLIKTRTYLQLAIEERLLDDPDGFDALESDDERFQAFAFETHARAYLAGGLAALPVEDLLAIAATPDLRDLLTPEGLAQILETAPIVAIADLARLFEGRS